MNASIKDVAARAGVSISTVSRIINGTAKVDEKKAEAVREAIAFYQYEPSQFGRGLVKQSTELVGVYFRQTEGSLFDSVYNLELLKGIERTLRQKGYSMVLISELPEGLEEVNPSFYQYIRKKRIDGLLLSGLNSCILHDSNFRELIESEYPVSYIGKKIHERGMHVYAQYEQYNHQMLQRLYQAGHQRILWVYMNDHEYYLDAVQKRVYAEMPQLQLYCVSAQRLENRPEGIELLKRMIQEEGCTAVSSPGMEFTTRLLSCFIQLGLRVPEDISIISVEHRKQDGATLYPAITAYYVPTRDMGACAAKQLMQTISNGQAEHGSVEFEAEYISRDSVKVLL